MFILYLIFDKVCWNGTELSATESPSGEKWEL